MRIGIQVSSNLNNRTGVEEYTYQILKNLPMVDDFKNHQFFIYTPRPCSGQVVRVLKWPFKKLWTQIRLSWEMRKNPVDILFVPAHTFPLIHPKLIITIQGLEFERMPKLYSFWKRKFLRWMTRRNLRAADKIIVPSQNTKNDLIKFYEAAPDKIFVVHHGVDESQKSKVKSQKSPKYILYLGRGDQRKNIQGLIKAFRILKQKHSIPHKLILAGPNIGYRITRDIKNDVICTGYVNEERKWQLLKTADVFVFPSFYEGFGIPVLEAQAVGTPVACSSTSSMPEVVGDSALFFNPYRPAEIAETIHKVLSNENLRNELIKKGYENVQHFSWLKCAEETLKVISNV